MFSGPGCPLCGRHRDPIYDDGTFGLPHRPYPLPHLLHKPWLMGGEWGGRCPLCGRSSMGRLAW